jgi:Domain of unknown function (DUF4291)
VAYREIRAEYDHDSIVVYQAYRAEIAAPAVRNQCFVPPFSLNRMTWIKPSLLWLMERSGWGTKSGQEHILAIRITRGGWEEALSQAVLTAYEPGIYKDFDDWRAQFDHATVRVQWDPERNIHGADLPYRSIQVGLSRHIIQRYVGEWTLAIQDITPLVHKAHTLVTSGKASRAAEMLPKVRVYPVEPALAKRLGME